MLEIGDYRLDVGCLIQTSNLQSPISNLLLCLAPPRRERGGGKVRRGAGGSPAKDCTWKSETRK